jgi:peptidoglycan/xylan/chitin deacetylase (PgdA/CDA1 family)
MLKTQLLQASFAAIFYSGAAQVLAPLCQGRGHIFCLHHVHPNGGLQTGFAPNSNLAVTPEFLDALITMMRTKHMDLVSLDEAVLRLRNNDTSRFAVFTLDDGYRDNLEHALPVFQKHQCPFTIYVAPRIAEGTCEMWWTALEAVIAKSEHVEVELSGLKFSLPCNSVSLKRHAWKILAPKFHMMDEYRQRSETRTLCERYAVDWKQLCRTAAMTWDELRFIAQSPLTTIGAHTLNHYNLMKLDSADAAHEIRESGQIVSLKLGRPVRHFAYPYGNVDAAGPREFAMCRDAGYDTAVVTRLGNLWSQHAQHLHALPRIMVSGRYQNQVAIDALTSGIPAMLANRFRHLTVG